MTRPGLVRPSRDGDQFHYHWAARRCLELLPGGVDLVAVTIEGASAEAAGGSIDAGEELIDVGMYFGAEGHAEARLVRYIQLKHSTRRKLEPWTASGLKHTVQGFAKRYAELLQRYPVDDVERRFQFEFTTNRPIEPKVEQALAELAAGAAVHEHPDLRETFVGFTELDDATASLFFRLFSANGGEADLWAQRNLLTQDVSGYLADADSDAPVQLKELVTRKATTEFASDPSIRRHDVLRALKASDEQLQPAPRLSPGIAGTLPREKEQEILGTVLAAEAPVVIHADAGVGKSVLAARLVASMPAGSEAILYDCFGDGLYRNALHFRHRHRDALVQIANELAARGLCHPLIPTAHADAKQYMRAFVYRLTQAIQVLRARDPNAQLCLIIDAADNAEIAAAEQREPASFVHDLISVPLPRGVLTAFTCRTHRTDQLGAPANAKTIQLGPFTQAESARHLRSFYASARDEEVAEFAFLSSANPRLQALALSRNLSLQDMLKQLGPTPTTVDLAIGGLLEAAVARLRNQAGITEAAQVDSICQALAVLRPLVPIRVVAQLSQSSQSAIRSFVLDFGRPLLLKGDSVHFIDEPAETWFRERFLPDPAGLAKFVDRLRPLAADSSYVAAALPQIMLQAGMLKELVDLALSGESLPVQNPLARRDVELQRVTFALKACLQQGLYVPATKLALKAGGESAGEQRQNNLIQQNTDLAATLVDADRVGDIVSRRIFKSTWMGSHHAYNAGLLSGRTEFAAESSSRLRMALDWLRAWARRPEEEREHEHVSDGDRVELALVLLRLRGAKAAAEFLRQWTSRRLAFRAGRQLGVRLAELGRYEQLDALAEAARSDVWLLLGLAAAAKPFDRRLPAAPLRRLLRVLGDRRVTLAPSGAFEEEWDLLYAVTSAIELAAAVLPPELEAWAAILRRYLPTSPPSSLASRYGPDRTPLLRAYALEAALRGTQIELLDVAPPDIRKQLESSRHHSRDQETDEFLEKVGGLLPWVVISTQVACRRPVDDLNGAIEAAREKTSSAASSSYRRDPRLFQAVAVEWLALLRHTGTESDRALATFKSWLFSVTDAIGPATLTALCRCAARTQGLERLALEFAATAFEGLSTSREDAESRADSYVALARAIFVVSPDEARVYFERAVEIASRIGDENLSRWTAFLYLASASGVRDAPRPRTAYRLSRAAELTYEYVERDKHFDWEGTVEAVTDLCASSALAILARWRDRRFGDSGRLLPTVIYRLVKQGRLPAVTSIGLAGLEAGWERHANFRKVVAAESNPARRATAAQIAYRYMRVQAANLDDWTAVKKLGTEYQIDFADVDRLVAASDRRAPPAEDSSSPSLPNTHRERRRPDWDAIFNDVDLADADKMRTAYAAVRTFDPPYEFSAFFREAFARVKAGRESELIRAIVLWPDFGVFELRDLLDALPAPALRQVSVQNATRDAVLAVCRREPQYVQRRGWGSVIPFEKLDADGTAPDADVVRATLEGFTAQVDTLDASNLFRLVHALAACLSPDEANEALIFGLDLLEEILKPEDGDGAWQSELEPPQSLIAALGGYIWAGLGSPIVAERWQHAHVVRSIVELDWIDLLHELISCASRDTASPFVDRQFQFYTWHARQWLLIGLSRGGLENPKALRPAMTLLQQMVRQEHVLLKELAAESLRTLVAAGECAADDAAGWEVVNQSEWPDRVYSGWSEPIDDEAPSEAAETDDEKYYFGIDITPYWFGPLGRAFGLSESAVERRVKQVLRSDMGWSGGNWKTDARHTRRIFDDGETSHSHGSMPKTDDLVDYHGYHGMMIVAGQLLRERRLLRSSEDATSRFRQWLAEHLLTAADGRWLFDRRDPRLVREPPPPLGYDDKAWCFGVSAADLDLQLSCDDGMIVLWGHWDGSAGDLRDHEETITVRSALVSRDGAEALVASMQTAPELDRFMLPDADESERFETECLKLTAWVKERSMSARLDEGDTWARGRHYPGPTPSEEAVERLDLIRSADGRKWSSGTGGVLRSETWTHVRGYGRDKETVAGSRLSGNRPFVKLLHDSYPDERLVLSVSIRRRLPRQQRDDYESYRAQYVRYYLMGADGVAHTL